MQPLYVVVQLAKSLQYLGTLRIYGLHPFCKENFNILPTG